jgi:hypothetical protein
MDRLFSTLDQAALNRLIPLGAEKLKAMPTAH